VNTLFQPRCVGDRDKLGSISSGNFALKWPKVPIVTPKKSLAKLFFFTLLFSLLKKPEE